MPKHGFLTPKAIANRIKSKGLQKLRWYCEMCNKQCRDENGFKCHIMSESHQRQLLLVAENPEKFVDNFSNQFLDNFIKLLRRRYNTKRVMANIVYNEYIADKEHIHMNATKWKTLTEFVKFLGREGHCIVDETPKGWFIQWLDRDPEEEARKRKIERREAKEKDEEQRQAELMQKQMERDRQLAESKGETFQPEYTSLQRAEGESIKLAMQPKKDLQAAKKTAPAAAVAPIRIDASSAIPKDALEAFKAKGKLKDGNGKRDDSSAKRPVSMLEKLRMDIEEKKRAKLERQQREEEERRKKKEEEAAKMKAMAQATGGAVGKDGAAGEDASWLAKDIVVKIINKTLADGKYYKRKGYVKSLADAYTANVRLLDSKTTLRLDQAYLETVIPSVGGHVLILHGPHANCLGKLKDIDYDKFSADIKVLEGSGKGTRVMLPYEHFSKFYEPKA